MLQIGLFGCTLLVVRCEKREMDVIALGPSELRKVHRRIGMIF